MFKEVKTKKYFAIHSWKLWPKYQNTCRFYFYISWIIVSVLHSVGWEEWEEAQDKLQQKVIILIYLLFFFYEEFPKMRELQKLNITETQEQGMKKEGNVYLLVTLLVFVSVTTSTCYE